MIDNLFVKHSREAKHWANLSTVKVRGMGIKTFTFDDDAHPDSKLFQSLFGRIYTNQTFVSINS